MLERDENGRPEGYDRHDAATPKNADATDLAGLTEPISAELADSETPPTNNVRPFLEQAEPVFEAELADVSPNVPRGPAPRRGRRVLMPVVLFFLTCLTTFVAGSCGWWPMAYLFSELQGGQFDFPLRRALLLHWGDGLIYMACLLGILLTHEMGHFIATLRYRIPASLPFFLPFPPAPFGTLGAVIAMDGRRANRKETFDIGIAGPLAGLVVALPVLWIGVGSLDLSGPGHGMFRIEPPLVAKWMLALRQPAGYVQGELIWQSQLNPYLMAGWFGMIITGLNMMPVSQLDGGHVIHTLFGKRARWIGRGFIALTIAAMALDFVYRGLFLMLIMIMFIGVDHPPTSDDSVEIGTFRTVLGFASLSIPILCFAPKLFQT